MEDEENEEKQVKKEPPKPVTYKLFLNDMNSWFSNFVIEKMRTDQKPDALIKYDFMGTVNSSERKLPSLFTPKIIKMDYNSHYKTEIFQNDIFIFNMENANFNDIDYIIKGLKALTYETEKTLVIITSIMTWARTPPKLKKEEQEQPEEEQEEGDAPKEEEKKENPEENAEEKEPESEEEEYNAEEAEALPEGEVDDEKKEEEEEKKEAEEGAEGQEVKEPPKILLFKEKDFIKRVPSKKFYHNKMVETLALANTNPKLKAYIVCSGIIYGCGENLLYDYFKMGWLQQPEKLPIINKGKNTIPTIHIKDLVSLVQRVVETKPKSQYIFAVDHTKNKTLKNLMKCISKGVGTSQFEYIENFEKLREEDKIRRVPHYEELSIDLKVKSTKVFNDERKDDEEDEAFEKRKFPWHCEFGIPENIEKLRVEFNQYRGMKNVKLFITGPPGSGKTYLAEKLSKFYNIPHFKIKDIIEWGKTLKDELGEEITQKTEEINNNITEAKDTYNKRQNRKITDLPLDISQISKYPDEIIIKLLRRKLAQNICRNRGYILDGYPRSYKVAFNLWNEDTDESKPLEDPTKFKVLEDILPNAVIRIDNCTDQFLFERMKKLPDISDDPTIIESRLTRRLKAYKELNESEKGEPSLTDFFKENKVDILGIDVLEKEMKILEKSKVFLERNGKILNYQIFDNIIEKEIKEKEKEKVDIKIKKQDKELEENEFYDIQKAEAINNFNKSKASDLDKTEKQMLDQKSEVLRRYLAENVIPVLSKGILHICKTLPQDPVDSLAYYLFDNSFNAKFPPHKYGKPDENKSAK